VFAGLIVYYWTNISSYLTLSRTTGAQTTFPKESLSTTLGPGETRQDEPFRFVTTESGFPTSAAHCSLSTMTDKAWEGAMCSFKNLCYNPSAKQFTFYKAIPEIGIPPHGMNLGKRTEFFPKVVEGKLPLPRYDARDDETWIFMEMNSNSVSTLEDFLRDDLFAWWLLSQHATWADQKTVLRPLATAASPAMTPQMEAWYRALPFAPLLTENDLAKFDAPVCFPRLVVGLGSMSDHCLLADHDFHEMKRPRMGVAVEAIPCATGRGPLFYRLRELMISRLGAASDTSPVDKPSKQTVLFAEETESGEFAQLERQAREKLPDANVLRKCVSCLSPKDQMELALTVAVYVTRPSGPQTLAAHFLRRGAGVVLVEKPPYKHTNFGLWNNLAYIRARWVQKDADIVRAIQLELEKAEAFM
jgi:hypothetical protein